MNIEGGSEECGPTDAEGRGEGDGELAPVKARAETIMARSDK